MDAGTIALLALVLSTLVSAAGGFAYITGELRKASAAAKRDNDQLRDHLNARIDNMATRQTDERNALRSELLGTITRMESEIRVISERAVRRGDLEGVEGRLTRSTEKTEGKIDALSAKVTEFLLKANASSKWEPPRT